jgi:hypothetical protein
VADALERECDVFCRYLAGIPADDYLKARYRATHERGAVEPAGGASAYDRALVAFARISPLAARCVDAHARIFAGGGLLRRKLVLALALLEVRAPERVDSVTSGSRAGFFVRAAFLAGGFAVMLAVSTLILLPVRLACAVRG